MGHTNHYLAIEGEAKDWEEAIRLCGQAIADAGYADETFMNACICLLYTSDAADE